MRPLFYALAAITCVFLVPGASSPSHAEPPPESISLEQALGKAIAGNVNLIKERVNIEAADANILATRGQFDFQLLAGLNFQRATQPPLTAQDISSGFTNTLALTLGVNRQLETGGRLSFSAETDAINTNSRLSCGSLAGVPQTCTFYNSTLGLTFNHPLLRGFGTEITLDNLRKARVSKDIALLNRQMRAANVLRDVVVAYWELAYSTQDLSIRKSAVDQAREQLRITQAQIDVGRLAPIDRAAVEQAIASRLQEVAVSEQTLYFRTLDLKQLFGMPPDPSQPAYAAADVPNTSGQQVDPGSEVNHALAANPQLRALKMGMQLNAIDVQTARDTLRPRLDFVGTIGARGRNSTLPETLAQAAGLDQLTWSAGLNFQAAVENRTASGAMRLAETVFEQGRLDAGAFELTVRDSVMRYAAQIRSASTRVDLAKQAVGFAEQNLEAEKARFSVGRSTNNDVLLRQQELKTAQIAVARATVDLLDADANLSAITAEILDRYRIVLKGM
jgi:outer membrane protein